MQNNNVVCFSGHRPPRLPEGEALRELEARLFREIKKAVATGYDTFLFGGCYGFDFLAAHQVLRCKDAQTGAGARRIQLFAVVPFQDQDARWSQALKNEYRYLLSRCDTVIILQTGYRREYYLDRNRYMVDNSACLICYYDGSKGGTGQTVAYAKTKGLEIFNLFK